jgi:predicted Ser/Thr protein kinase
VSLLGAGGMGEVYRASDPRLGREVAIKVSAAQFSERFEREARAVAALNHPHICHLYDIGPNYLVMEFVEGETLSAVIGRGRIPLDKVLTYGMQIVEALAAAHRKGIVHRDLKPANILVTSHGVKLLDFGLAKLTTELMASVPGVSAAVTAANPITGAGSILGTLHYMSPEQVEARDVDERADIFSFGTVMYEMVTGQRAFPGATQAGVLAAILKDQPPSMSERQTRTPRALDRIVRRCLEKKPEDRWQSALDLKPALELVDLDLPASTSSDSMPPSVAPAIRRRWVWPVVATLVIGMAMLVFVRWPQQPVARVTRFEVPLPENVTVDPGVFYVRVSPDGSKLAFTTTGEKGGIWVRDLSSLDARLLTGTRDAVAPFWAPDGRSLAFGLGNKLMRVDTSGNPPQVLAEAQFTPGSGFWTNDGQIVFGHRGQGSLMRVAATGGVPVPMTQLENGEVFHGLPSLLPDGHRFLYLRINRDGPGIYSGAIDVKPEQQSRERIAAAQFGVTDAPGRNAAGGYLFFVRDETLMAQPFDAGAMRFAGEPMPVVTQIGRGPTHAFFSVTAGGVMAYRTVLVTTSS